MNTLSEDNQNRVVVTEIIASIISAFTGAPASSV